MRDKFCVMCFLYIKSQNVCFLFFNQSRLQMDCKKNRSINIHDWKNTGLRNPLVIHQANQTPLQATIAEIYYIIFVSNLHVPVSIDVLVALSYVHSKISNTLFRNSMFYIHLSRLQQSSCIHLEMDIRLVVL